MTRQEENGLRKYNTPDGKKLVSVTTILSKTSDMSHLDEWRTNLGSAKADRITNESAALGAAMHNNLERYVLGGEEFSGSFMARALAKVIIKGGLSKVNEVWGAEVPLYSQDLWAGTCDLIGINNGVPSIMDYKNSLREKKKEWIDNYFMQLVAYSLSHNHMFNTNIRRGVVMIATRDARYQEFVIEGEEFNRYEVMWIDRVCAYYDLVGIG